MAHGTRTEGLRVMVVASVGTVVFQKVAPRGDDTW